MWVCHLLVGHGTAATLTAERGLHQGGEMRTIIMIIMGEINFTSDLLCCHKTNIVILEKFQAYVHVYMSKISQLF